MKHPDDNALAQAGQLPPSPFTDAVPIGSDGSPVAEAEDGFPPLSPQSPPPLALPDSALHGLAGDFVRLVEPHTEACAAALLGQLLVGFGNLIGRGAYFLTEADRQHTNEYLGLVGDTAKGRKGTSWGHVRKLFETLDPDWTKDRVQHGLSTGEGLIWTVHDDVVEKEAMKKRGIITHYQDVVKAHAVKDKRILFQESELASALRLAGREGNTLSPVLRCAWDSGDLRSTTKNSPGKATGAHVSVIGHITSVELLHYLSVVEAGNGFANRFLWFWTYRSKVLPDGGNVSLDAMAALASKLRQTVAHARGAERLEWHADARRLWHEVYEDLSAAYHGLLGKVTARAEAHVVRLALLYALLDAATCIRRVHLEAALGVWEYAFRSAAHVFGNSVGDRLADKILLLVEASPKGLTRTELRQGLADNKITARHIDIAVSLLVRWRLVEVVKEGTTGRAATRLRATGRGMGRLGILGSEVGRPAPSFQAPVTGGAPSEPPTLCRPPAGWVPGVAP